MYSQWLADGVTSYFAEFLCTFRIVYWLKQLSWDVYVIIFYIVVFLVFVVIIDFLYVSISFRHKKFSFTQPIQILKIACQMIVTILYIPIAEFFLSLSECANDPVSGQLLHVVFPEVVCFQSIHIVHISISYIMLLIFGLMVLITILLNYENRYTKDPTSKLNARTDLFMLLSKSAYVFFFTFFSQGQYALFKSIILVVFSSMTFMSFLWNRPYFSQATQTIVEVFAGIFAWTNWVLLFTQIISGTQFTGSLEILFLGIPIVITLIYTRQEDRNKILMTAEQHFERGDICQKKNFYYIYIIETREVVRQSSIILKGYINHHTEVCPYDTCPIKAYKKIMLREKQAQGSERKKRSANAGKKQSIQTDNNQLLHAQAKALYMNGMRKFPKYVPLRIDYANFLQSRVKDRKGALNELVQAEKCKPGFDHQFMIFRERKIIEDELAEGQEHGGIDFIAALNFENMFKQFKALIEKSAMLHFEFWNHLQDDSPDLVRLSLQGAKINQSILTVEENWKKLSRMSSNAPKALKLYASYLIEVLNDKETGNEQMIKAKEAANLRVNFEFNSAAAVNQDSDVNSYAQDGTPCIYISGEQERLGVINQCNMSLCKIFGYTKKEDILNKNIKILQPKIYSEHHDDFLNVSIEKSADQISSRERQIFGKHFSGYVFPLWLQIKNLPSLLSGRQFVATFKVEKTGVNKSAAYLLFSKDRELVDISPSCLQMLGISFESLHKKQIYYDVQSLFPNLYFNGVPNGSLLNKAGSHILYYYPRIVEYSVNNPQGDNSNTQETQVIRKRRQQTDGTNNYGDEDDIKRAGTTGENTQDINAEADEKMSINDENVGGQEDDGAGGRSYSLSQQKSVKSSKNEKTPGGTATKKPDDDGDDDNDNTYQKYLYRAVASERQSNFQANMTEIFFELIQVQGGHFLRLETIVGGGNNLQANQQLAKRVLQQAFQFSYDPIFKRFTRELRDPENKDYNIDKHYLDLKVKKEQSKVENPSDPNAHRYAAMSYINYLNRQQRLIERGAAVDDFDDDEEGQSEDESNLSGEDNKAKTKTPTGGKPSDANQAIKLANFQPNAQNPAQNQIGGQGGIVDYSKILVAGEGFGREFLKGEIERLIRMLQEKQSVGQGVHTFIRVDGARKGWEEDNNQKAGLFSDRGGEMEKIEGEGDEDDNQGGKDSSDKGGDGDSLKANIKSKKAFSMAINDKTMPPAIKRLSTTAQIILACLVAIAISEYAIIYQQVSDTKANFTLIQQAYERTAELQKVAYNARSMILMANSPALLTNPQGYATIKAYQAFIIQEFSNSLDLIYQIQNEINLSQLPISDAQNQLLNNQTVTLYFKETATSMKALQFSLTESILQISSTIFTISNMAPNTFAESNEDVFFLMYNSFNDFYQGLLQSSQLYVQELSDRANQKEEISLILYILAVLSLVLAFVVLIPVVHSVNQQKDKVLSLFCEIDNSVIRLLAQRCEKFINGLQTEEGNDEIDSNEEMDGAIPAEDDTDEYNLLSGTGKRVKKAKGKTKTDKKFFFWFFIALNVVHAYYLQNYILNGQSVTAAQVLSQELNVTCVTEPFYWFALNTQREMEFNPSRVITNLPSIQVSVANIYELYDQQNTLQEMHLNDQGYLSTGYWSLFEQIMRSNLCPSITYFQTLNSTSCDTFISGTLDQGLHVVIVRYFETLRNMLNNYQNYTSFNDTKSVNTMFNLQDYYELDVIQYFVTQNFMRQLVGSLSTDIQNDFSNRVQTKIAIFIVFLIIVLISFIIFWLPFLNGLNYQIYKTKLMLMIIPLEVLMKIKNVGKVLQSQSFITQSQKKGGSSRKSSESG